MKVLKLGSSGVQSERLQPGALVAHEIAGEKLRIALGEHVEMRARLLWPSAGMIPAVQKWLSDAQPDVLYMIIPTFWFGYESVPLRLERRFGRFGKRLATTGLRAADNPKLAYNPAFRAGRRLAHALIGGETHFAPDYVVTEIGRLLRSVLTEHEQLLVVVHGPQGWNAYHSSKRANRRAEERRLFVDARLRQLCGELHVPYFGTDLPMNERGIQIETTGDGLHAAEQSQEFLGEKDFRYLHQAICAHRASLDVAARATS
ncbi:MAG: hypothetical protein ABI782_02555 [Anaerolineaceae bacterium]